MSLRGISVVLVKPLLYIALGFSNLREAHMKIETNGRELKAAMRLLKGVVNPGIASWCATLLRVTEEGKAFLEACDGEKSIRISLEETCGNVPGTAAVATRCLCEIASAMGTKEPINLEAGEKALVVTGANSRSWTAPVIIDELDDVIGAQATGIEGETGHFSLPRAALVRLFGRVSYAMSDEATRYYLCGIYLHLADGQLKTAATDGNRLAVASVAAPEGARGMAGVILPRDTVHLLEKALAKATAEDVTITLAGERVAFSWPRFRLVTKLVDGTFPEYERVIPKKNGCTLSFTTESPVLAAMTQRAPGKFSRAILSLSEALPVAIETGETDGAMSRVEDAAAFYSGAAIKVAFQPRHLHDLVGHLEGAPEFHFKDDRGPVLIHDTGDSDVLHVLMPMWL